MIWHPAYQIAECNNTRVKNGMCMGQSILWPQFTLIPNSCSYGLHFVSSKENWVWWIAFCILSTLNMWRLHSTLHANNLLATLMLSGQTLLAASCIPRKLQWFIVWHQWLDIKISTSCQSIWVGHHMIYHAASCFNCVCVWHQFWYVSQHWWLPIEVCSWFSETHTLQ